MKQRDLDVVSCNVYTIHIVNNNEMRLVCISMSCHLCCCGMYEHTCLCDVLCFPVWEVTSERLLRALQYVKS